MRLPVVERAELVIERHMPGVARSLREHNLAELESEQNPGIEIFRRYGGSRLVIPAAYGGLEASPGDVVQVQFMLGRLAPSTAVAVTMHQFTAGTFRELLHEASGMEWLAVEAVATQSLLVASAFAEGDPNGRVLEPSMTLVADGPGYRLTGVKRPCSLTASMDMITVSVRLPAPSEQFAVALIGRETDGLTVEPFWENSILAGTETGAVKFDNVSVPRSALSYVGTSADFDRTQARGYTWFELCISSAYLGIASILVDMAWARADDASKVEMASELEAGLAMLGEVARRLDDDLPGEDLLAHALLVRFSVERAIQRVTDRAFEGLGVNVISSDPVSTGLLAACRALAFHPPSRRRCLGGMAAYLSGEPLRLDA
jgi:alkylation response protein AidB-like acyl-CoA dehydrogenase